MSYFAVSFGPFQSSSLPSKVTKISNNVILKKKRDDNWCIDVTPLIMNEEKKRKDVKIKNVSELYTCRAYGCLPKG